MRNIGWGRQLVQNVKHFISTMTAYKGDSVFNILGHATYVNPNEEDYACIIFAVGKNDSSKIKGKITRII